MLNVYASNTARGFSLFSRCYVFKCRSREELLPILKTPEVLFVNLQYSCSDEDIKFISDNDIEFVNYSDINPLLCLDDYSSLIQALDLVITIDNSAIQIAPALGVETWGLITYVSDWRMMIDRNDSIWHSSLRLFRQSEMRNWYNVIEEVKKSLSEFCKIK